MRIAVFCGHAGKDSGAIDPTGPGDDYHTTEAEITRPIASKVARYLSDLDLDHILAYGSWKSRVESTRNCHLGVSIHCDISATSPAHGYHLIHYKASKEGLRLATSIDAAMGLTMRQWRKPHTRTYPGGGQPYIIRSTRYPCVIVEVGFLSNPLEEAWLQVEASQYNIAFAIVTGIRGFLYQ